MKPILALILAFLEATAATAAPVPPADQAAIRAFLTKLYGSYKNDKVRTATLSARGASSVFTPSTDRLKAENDRLANGENAGLDFDFFCGCNDYDKSLKLAGVSLTPLPKGRVNARVQVSNYGTKTINIQFEKTPVGWRVFDVELTGLGMLRTVLAKENAELSKVHTGAAAPPPPRPTAMPAQISYAGPSQYKTYETVQYMELKISGSVISGVIATQAFGRLVTVPVAGTYANGACSVQLKSDTFSGPCDAHGFSGNRLSRKGEIVGSFAFKNVDEIPAGRASTNAPSPITTTATGPAYTDSAPAQMQLVPSFERSRLLIEPGGGCSPAGQLAKGYCFDLVIGYLQRHPELTEVTVVTMTRSYLLGTWVPLNSGQGWNVYEVNRQARAPLLAAA